ncbi:hypothetical protein [Bacillus wiedmannii]|uniref:hypothetical protein n=1 Tax=Bacillus wiedmannii TaxID=1890302 RepID=UPI000BF1C416|nr:hypothetical protein [Bacillus wiedmannii]PEJ69168.1 hypothetical protein CN888_25690 [Bacillus wiedmannii]PHA29107.1 hypothetical protein COE69_27410 [Bacillus wiedmannii]PHG49190.1 hypothetical protein COI54_10850 [Bacillus wiedmannii]
MRTFYVYDKQTGRYLENVIIFPSYDTTTDNDGNMIEWIPVYKNIPENATEIPLPQPNWKPVWDGEKWIETITEEELEEMNKPQPHKPSEIEKLNALITEMKDKQETLEEENAGLVLSSIKKEMTLELMQEEQSALVLNLIKGGVL